MTDIEQRLRAAMHAGVDAEEASAGYLITQVKRLHRRHVALVACVATLIALAVGLPAAIALHSLVAASNQPALHHSEPGSLPVKMTGTRMRADTTFQLPMGSPPGNGFGYARPAWYSTATRQATPISGVPRYGAYAYTRVQGGWLVSDLLIHWTCPPHCWLPYYFVADGSARATRVGVGFWGVPSDRAGAVWLVGYPRGKVDDSTTSAMAQLVSTTGHALSPPHRLPADVWPVRGVSSYLLLKLMPVPQNDVSELWDPSSGRVVRRFSNVISAGPEQIAWDPRCLGCRVQVLNVETGKVETTPISGWAWQGGQPKGLTGTFTDDGKLLAVLLPSHELAVYDTSTGALTEIPGSAVSDDYWQHFSWQTGSHRLIVTALWPGIGGVAQIAYWQPGQAGLRVTTVHSAAEAAVIWGQAFGPSSQLNEP